MVLNERIFEKGFRQNQPFNDEINTIKDEMLCILDKSRKVQNIIFCDMTEHNVQLNDSVLEIEQSSLLVLSVIDKLWRDF